LNIKGSVVNGIKIISKYFIVVSVM
jgi:hypothetical protein